MSVVQILLRLVSRRGRSLCKERGDGHVGTAKDFSFPRNAHEEEDMAYLTPNFRKKNGGRSRADMDMMRSIFDFREARSAVW
jgi:hypothetical protein